MADKSSIDILWVLISAALVFLMQGGFLCLETGLTRSKNHINVAIKNLTDFAISIVLFWALGYAFMFGQSSGGWIGTTSFVNDFGEVGVWITVFFLFQAVFCGTAVTILSGAIAERIQFKGYIIISILVSFLIYPVFGHWVWNGLEVGEANGWLGKMGFLDFAGSTVVHSVGGWVSLAALLVIGPRSGRFPKDGPPNNIPGADVPISTFGVVLLWLGWIGFNGGSTLAMDETVPIIVANTMLAAGAGLIGALGYGWVTSGNADVEYVMNGALGGLVAITANCYAVSAVDSLLIGLIGGFVVVWGTRLLERLKIDDAIGAIPVHLGAGIWGTLALAIFGDPETLGTGLGFWEQLGVQSLGIGVCGVWTFGVSYFLIKLINGISPLRVSAEDEYRGLNVSEHGATTTMFEMFQAMDRQTQTKDTSIRVPVEPFTEVGQIAERYNSVMDGLQEATENLESKVEKRTEELARITSQNEWLKKLSTSMHGQKNFSALGNNILSSLVPALDLKIGAIFIKDGNGSFKRVADYTYPLDDKFPGTFEVGVGMLGRVASQGESIHVDDVAQIPYIHYGFGKKTPRYALLYPVKREEDVISVLELVTNERLTEHQVKWLEEVARVIALGIYPMLQS